MAGFERANVLVAAKNDADGEIALALAEFAAAHGLSTQAAAAFDRAATSAQAPARLIARSGFELAKTGDEEATQATLRRAAGAAVSPEETALVAVLTAASNEDASAILAASDGYAGPEPLVSVLRARALDVEGRSDEAADLAMDALREHPMRATVGGLALEAARLLLVRAQAGGAARGAARLADRARQLALEVRDWRREWNGPSEDAVVVAMQAAAASHDFEAVVRLGTRPPRGEASDREASASRVIAQAARGAAAAGSVADARALAERLDDPVERNLIEALCMELEDRPSDAIPLLLGALEAATTDEQLAHAYMALAGLGEWPLPGLEDLESREPQLAQVIRGHADLVAGNRQAAIQRLRKVGGDQALLLLVAAYMEDGKSDDAVEALVEAADRDGKPHLRLQATSLLASEGRFQEALDHANRGLTHAPMGGHAHREFRRLCIRLAGTLRLWQDMIDHARAAIEEGDDSAVVEWALVGGLHNLRRDDAARQEMRSRALEPRSEQEALLAIHLWRTGEPTTTVVAKVLDLADRFSDSEPVMASAFAAFFELSQALDLPEEVGARVGPLTEAFFATWPDSKLLTRIDTSDLDKLVDYMRDTFGTPRPELEEVVAKAYRGQVPLGLAAAVVGRSLGTLLVTNALGSIPVGSVDPTQAEREQDAARAALDHPAVVDAHALFLTGHLGFPARDLTSRFSRIYIARYTLDDLVSSADSLRMRSTATLGWHAPSDKPSLTEIPPELADRWAIDADELVERARQCTTRHVDLPQSRTDDERLGIVLGPLELARNLGCALWSDDPAVRIVASAEDIPAFSTSALMATLVSGGYLSEVQNRSAALEMAQAGAVDIPFDVELLMDLAERERWAARSAAVQLSRPLLWQNPAVGLKAYQGCLTAAAAEAPDDLPAWTMSACLGACRAIDPVARAEIVAGLVLNGFMHLGSRGSFLPSLVDGARRAAPELELADPIGGIARTLRDLVKDDVGASLAPQIFASMISDLDDTDRMVALGEFLDPDAR
jgi:tetratricopeptide (TPR) repeat protein